MVDVNQIIYNYNSLIINYKESLSGTGMKDGGLRNVQYFYVKDRMSTNTNTIYALNWHEADRFKHVNAYCSRNTKMYQNGLLQGAFASRKQMEVHAPLRA